MTIFVTGSESFIGKNLIRICRNNGIDIVGVDAAPTTQSGFIQADICDAEIADAIPEGATIVHLAAISRDPDCRADPKRAFDINVVGTLNLAAAARRRNAKQFVFASSEWVYGDVCNDEVQNEDQAIDFTTMKSEYAVSKLVGEQLLRLDKNMLATTVLRFGIVYGPRAQNWSAVEALCNTMMRESAVKIGSAKTARRFIHVDDICSGILASRGRQGFEIFNLSGDALVTLGDIVKSASAILNKAVEIGESDPARPSIRNPDNKKIKAQIGWRPEVGIYRGLKSVIDFLATQ